MSSTRSIPSPSGHTEAGGVLLGSAGAPHHLVVFEDPQCPYCRRFEEVCGGVLRTARTQGTVAVEYRMRCFLGIESVRADNALALAAEEGRFDELREQLFASQPEEGTGGFTVDDLRQSGERAGLTGADYRSGLEEGRYEAWVLQVEQSFQAEDPGGTPAAWLDGGSVDSRILSDPRRLGSLLGL